MPAAIEATHDSQLRSRYDAETSIQTLAQSTAAGDSGYERFFSDNLTDGTPGPRMAFIPADSFVRVLLMVSMAGSSAGLIPATDNLRQLRTCLEVMGW